MTKKWFLLKVFIYFYSVLGKCYMQWKTVLANEYTIVDENTVVYKDLVTGETGCLEYQKDNCSIAAFLQMRILYYETITVYSCKYSNRKKHSEIVPYGVIGDDDRRRIHDTTNFLVQLWYI